MEAVLGAEVAKATGLGVGSRFFGAHGLAADGPVHAEAEYRVTGVLGTGGQSVVWAAVDGRDGRPVAVKAAADRAASGAGFFLDFTQFFLDQ